MSNESGSEPETESGRAFVRYMTASLGLSAAERIDLCLAVCAIEQEAVLDAAVVAEQGKPAPDA